MFMCCPVKHCWYDKSWFKEQQLLKFKNFDYSLLSETTASPLKYESKKWSLNSASVFHFIKAV